MLLAAMISSGDELIDTDQKHYFGLVLDITAKIIITSCYSSC
jgi:hypothetical protein